MCPREVDGLYVVVSYTRAHGRVIRPGLSLVEACRLVEHLGHGAVFRSEGMSAYSRPVYPVVPRGRAGNPHVRTAADAAAVAATAVPRGGSARRAVVRHEGSLV
jgi:hypothetical protein